MRTLTKEMQKALNPAKALELLKHGNERFTSHCEVSHNYIQEAKDTSTGQFPCAVILSCMDSRTSAELIFDQGIGDLLSLRVAGNVLNSDILGSIEYGCKVLGAKIIVVLGHTKCSAIMGACDNVKMGHLTGLLSKIRPAVDAEANTTNNRTSKNAEFVDNVTAINIKITAKAIQECSPIMSEMIDSGAIGIVGGIHDICTGVVTFYPDTMSTSLVQQGN